MVEETPTSEQLPEKASEGAEGAEPSKVSVHIIMTTEGYERVKKFAEYAVIEGLIEKHPRGSFSDYCNFCFNLVKNIRQTSLTCMFRLG